MDSGNLDQVERRLRRSYEWSRLRRALWGFAPVLLLVAAATWLTHRPSSAAAFGLALFAFGVSSLWYGRGAQRAVLPGLALGLIPLVLALCANHLHHCSGSVCTTLCVPACSAGGVLAGLGTAIIGYRQQQGFRFWIAASLVALLTGAMGCSCVGGAGVVGLVAGFGLGTATVFVAKRWRRPG